MRNLEECKAEIFRLGDKKIKQRKKRRMRTLSVCVPLCLCLVVFSATVLPTMLTAEDKNTKQPLTELEDESVGTTFYQYTQVEINGFGDISFCSQINDSREVSDIAELINSFYYLNDSEEYRPNDGVTIPTPPTSSDELFENPETILPDTGEAGYSILFTTDKGEKIEYILTGNALENKNTGDKMIITDDQMTELFSNFTGGD